MNTQTYPFTLSPLGYELGALEPTITAETMMHHHDIIVRRYVERLNAVLENYPQYHSWTIEQLIRDNTQLPREIASEVLITAGGIFNHDIYFDIMTPGGADMPYGRLYDEIVASFGSYENFQNRFVQACNGLYGSGYCALVKTRRNGLKIITMQNQETPIEVNLYPVIMNDMWEHSYFLDYQSSKDDYVDAWMKLINWDTALENYNYDYAFRRYSAS